MIPWQLDQMYDFLDFNTLVKVAPNKGILARRIGRMQYGIRVPEDFKTYVLSFLTPNPNTSTLSTPPSTVSLE